MTVWSQWSSTRAAKCTEPKRAVPEGTDGRYCRCEMKNICLKRKQKTFEPFSHILKRSIKVCHVWTSPALFVRPATRCSDPRGDQNGSWLQIPSGTNATLTHSSWANFILIVFESIKCSKSRSFSPRWEGVRQGCGVEEEEQEKDGGRGRRPKIIPFNAVVAHLTKHIIGATHFSSRMVRV